jgi:hypothetical protein
VATSIARGAGHDRQRSNALDQERGFTQSHPRNNTSGGLPKTSTGITTGPRSSQDPFSSVLRVLLGTKEKSRRTRDHVGERVHLPEGCPPITDYTTFFKDASVYENYMRNVQKSIGLASTVQDRSVDNLVADLEARYHEPTYSQADFSRPDRSLTNARLGNLNLRTSSMVGEECARVVADLEARYDKPATSQADFFRPDVLSHHSEGTARAPDAQQDNEMQQIHAANRDIRSHFSGSYSRPKHAPYGAPLLDLIPPTPTSDNESSSYFSNESRGKSIHAPYGVPQLTVTAPTLHPADEHSSHFNETFHWRNEHARYGVPELNVSPPTPPLEEDK